MCYRLSNLIVAAVLLLCSCETTDSVTEGRSGKFFYTCEIPKEWIQRLIASHHVHVLSWGKFSSEAWSQGYQPQYTRAFSVGYDVYLRWDYTLDHAFHELGHTWDRAGGNYTDHPVKCWSLERPWDYDETVRAALDGITFPRLEK